MTITIMTMPVILIVDYFQGGQGGLDNDDIMLINLSDIVFEALNCVAGNKVSFHYVAFSI